MLFVRLHEWLILDSYGIFILGLERRNAVLAINLDGYFFVVWGVKSGLGFESGYGPQESQGPLSFSGIQSECKPPGPKPTVYH